MTDRTIDFTAPVGTFEEWNLTRPVIVHIMRELARGHWEDGGERFGGFAAATAGLNIAVIADEGRPAEAMVAGILYNVNLLAAVLAADAATAEQRVALSVISDATTAWKA